ncbi:hypothetical protein NDU88_002230 [Pleurodeles waltl]|uniref:Uncharacterized protein n=1 Tax=Pleurodeles waltl TaxID=8319 RepID=A0AAV7MM12_PLEWA|nr:hypothetical protein NDU88_002230 [Pleurodeles waltl]
MPTERLYRGSLGSCAIPSRLAETTNPGVTQLLITRMSRLSRCVIVPCPCPCLAARSSFARYIKVARGLSRRLAAAAPPLKLPLPRTEERPPLAGETKETAL